MYRESRPDELAGAVVWVRSGDGGTAHRIMPDGCLDLIWSGGRLFVAGPDTGARLNPPAGPATHVGIRFPAGLGPAVLGVPAVELRDAQVPLDALWPAPAVRDLADALAAPPGPPGVVGRRPMPRRRRPPARLSRGGAGPGRGRPAGRTGPGDRELWHRLRAGSRVDDAADAVGLSARQLHRRSLHAFGYGPKTLARVLRFDRAVALARAGTALSTVAARTGYADQAHLAREIRQLRRRPADHPPRRTGRRHRSRRDTADRRR